MFERFDEKVRRAIFFSRHEASQLGCEAIEADFILLGIAREEPSICVRWLGANYAELREKIARLYTREKQIATSVDLPLSNASKRVLAYAAEEADRLANSKIGAEHLFLGLLREDGTASRLLKECGNKVANVRAAIAENPGAEVSAPRSHAPSPGLPMRFVVEDGGDLAVIPWEGRIPRIGESIRMPDAEDNETTYRILDLCWRVNKMGGVAEASEILIKVRKEEP
jgi:ATP-dependent Clp protease ATP-binding subunit ClpA